MDKIIYIFILVIYINLSNTQKIDPWEVRCLVCKATVQEIEDAISKVNPNKIAEVGTYRIDTTGNTVHKKVKYAKSELFLTELMEDICSKMDDYAKATDKKTGKLSVIKLILNGNMNPIASEVNFVQDEDLNKSLKHYCLEILEDHEQVFLDAFMTEKVEDDLDIKICSERAKYCKDGPIQEEYKLEDEEEFKDEL